jgi:tRNA(adenine34) deaminase
MPESTAHDRDYMGQAIAEARAAQANGDVPVGCLIVQGDRILARASNRTLADKDPTAHAELITIRKAASRLKTHLLIGCTLYVTLEPCAMCAGAIVLARMDRVVFGAWDPKAGMVGSVYDLLRNDRLNHKPEVLAGVRQVECAELLETFFRERREASA